MRYRRTKNINRIKRLLRIKSNSEEIIRQLKETNGEDTDYLDDFIDTVSNGMTDNYRRVEDMSRDLKVVVDDLNAWLIIASALQIEKRLVEQANPSLKIDNLVRMLSEALRLTTFLKQGLTTTAKQLDRMT